MTNRTRDSWCGVESLAPIPVSGCLPFPVRAPITSAATVPEKQPRCVGTYADTARTVLVPVYYFLATGFLTTGFLTAGFAALTAGLAAALATTFLATGFLAITFLATVFLTTVFLPTGFAVFFTTGVTFFGATTTFFTVTADFFVVPAIPISFVEIHVEILVDVDTRT